MLCGRRDSRGYSSEFSPELFTWVRCQTLIVTCLSSSPSQFSLQRSSPSPRSRTTRATAFRSRNFSPLPFPSRSSSWTSLRSRDQSTVTATCWLMRSSTCSARSRSPDTHVQSPRDHCGRLSTRRQDGGRSLFLTGQNFSFGFRAASLPMSPSTSPSSSSTSAIVWCVVRGRDVERGASLVHG